MKKTRHAILAKWHEFTAAEIVRLHKIHYANLRSAAVMLSRLKGELASLEDPPPDTYLAKLALSKKEYNEIRAQNSDARKRGAMDVVDSPSATATPSCCKLSGTSRAPIQAC